MPNEFFLVAFPPNSGSAEHSRRHCSTSHGFGHMRHVVIYPFSARLVFHPVRLVCLVSVTACLARPHYQGEFSKIWTAYQSKSTAPARESPKRTTNFREVRCWVASATTMPAQMTMPTYAT